MLLIVPISYTNKAQSFYRITKWTEEWPPFVGYSYMRRYFSGEFSVAGNKKTFGVSIEGCVNLLQEQINLYILTQFSNQNSGLKNQK